MGSRSSGGSQKQRNTREENRQTKASTYINNAVLAGAAVRPQPLKIKRALVLPLPARRVCVRVCVVRVNTHTQTDSQNAD